MKKVIKKHGRKIGTIMKGRRNDTECDIAGCFGYSEYYCDFVHDDGTKCDKALCSKHTKLIKHNTHHCRDHLE